MKKDHAEINLENHPAREVEVLPEGWERIKFDCPNCDAEAGLVIDVKFGRDKRAEVMIPVTKNCASCGISVSGEEDAV